MIIFVIQLKNNIMNKFKFLVLILFFVSNGCSSQSSLNVGILNPDSSFTVTATSVQLNAVFDNYTIMNDFDGVTFVINQDSITANYYVETTGIGTGPQLGDTIAMRVGISLIGIMFNWDLGADGETCKGSPCEQCKFAVGGGCECRREAGGAGGHCDHSITKGN